MSVPALPFGCATSVTACVMVLTLLRSPSGPAATVAAATPTKRRRSKSGGFDIPCLLTSFRSTSPTSARRWTPRQDPARYHDPHQAHDGPDEPRRGAVRCPESAAHPRGAAQYAEHDDCDPRPEEGVRDQPGPPEPERPCHDQDRARKRTQQDEDPREVIQSRCERLIAGSGNQTLTAGLNDFAWVLVLLSSFPRAILIMAGSFGLWRAGLISNALFGAGVAV